jgi:hypothetical protein
VVVGSVIPGIKEAWVGRLQGKSDNLPEKITKAKKKKCWE